MAEGNYVYMMDMNKPVPADTDSISSLTAVIRDFVNRRDWQQFHSPKDMAVAITAEASELLQLFVWKSSAESHDIAERKRNLVADEMADVGILLFELADILQLNLGEIMLDKIQRNESRYPADLSRGSNLKYNELPGSPDA